MSTGKTDMSPLLKLVPRHSYADAKAPMMALSLYSPRILWKTCLQSNDVYFDYGRLSVVIAGFILTEYSCGALAALTR